MAVAPLMIEHRLIERMIKVMKAEAASISRTGTVRPEFIDQAVDFIRVYADRCHHGKEEDILFKELAGKAMSDQYRGTMEELVQEHVRSRQMTGALLAAKDRYVNGDQGALAEMLSIMRALAAFYPVHIEKEDRHFFIPCMAYFSQHEQDVMLETFAEFDRRLIHEKYRSVIEKFEAKE